MDQRAKIILDVKCPGSGEAARNHWPNLDHLRANKDEVKFVIANREDWEFARDVTQRYELETRAHAVLISPAWEKVPERVGELDRNEWAGCASSVTDTQTHLGPETRGV